MKDSVTEKIKAVMLGHAVADALGVPVEFKTRDQLDGDPVHGMLGFGTYPVPAGAWSDDTSMSVCALDVLADGECDYDRIMVNFGRWYYNGEFTPTGETFDIGNTCRFAIDNYSAYKKPYTECGMRDEASNGNGSLMRISINNYSVFVWCFYFTIIYSRCQYVLARTYLCANHNPAEMYRFCRIGFGIIVP